MSSVVSSVECRYCSRAFASTYSRKRHEYLRHREECEKDSVVSDSQSVVSAAETVQTANTERSDVTQNSEDSVPSHQDHTYADSGEGNQGDDEEETDTDSNANSDDGAENNAWRLLLKLLAFRVRNKYYKNTILDEVVNVDQLWDPPYYKELIYRFRNLVHSIRRLNRLLDDDAVIDKIEEKIESLREKYKDDNLLNEYGVKEMAWEKLDYLIRGTLQRNKNILQEEMFDTSDKSDDNMESSSDTSDN